MPSQTSCVRQVRRDTYRTIYASYVAITGSVDAAILLDLVVRLTDNEREYADGIKSENVQRKKDGLKPHHVPDGWLYKTTEDIAAWSAGTLSVDKVKKLWPVLEKKGIIVNGGRHPDHQWQSTVRRRLDISLFNKVLETYERTQGSADSIARESEKVLPRVRNGTLIKAKPHPLPNIAIDTQLEVQEGEGRSFKKEEGAVSTRTPKQSPLPDGFLEPLPKGLEPLKQAIATVCGFKKASDWRTSDELTTQALTLNSQGVTVEEIRETVDANPKKHFKLKFFAQDVLALRGAAERSESGGYVHKAQNACRAGGDCGGGGVLVVIGANGQPSASQCECYGMA